MVTSNKITDTIGTIARATEAISAYVLFASGRLNSLMPTAQFDQFEKLDKPVMKASSTDDAYKLWDSLSSERDQYVDGVDAELIRAVKDDAAL